MAEPTLYVPDATVVGAWYLPEEPFDRQAISFYRDFIEGQIRLVAPSHIWYEVPSILSRAVGGGRIPVDEARDNLERFRSLRIPVVHSQQLINAGFEYSVSLQCSVYDATYLALADLVESPFIYADSRLRRSLRDRHPRALWIEDYNGH